VPKGAVLLPGLLDCHQSLWPVARAGSWGVRRGRGRAESARGWLHQVYRCYAGPDVGQRRGPCRARQGAADSVFGQSEQTAPLRVLQQAGLEQALSSCVWPGALRHQGVLAACAADRRWQVWQPPRARR